MVVTNTKPDKIDPDATDFVLTLTLAIALTITSITFISHQHQACEDWPWCHRSSDDWLRPR